MEVLEPLKFLNSQRALSTIPKSEQHATGFNSDITHAEN